MPDVLNTHLDDIVSSISAALPALQTCSTHAGRFTEDDIRRLTKAVPAVLVSALRIQPQAQLIAPKVATIGIYIVTRDQPGLARDRSARSIAEYLHDWLRGRAFAGGHAVTDVDAANLYSGKLESIGISLWGISFKSPLQDLQVMPSRGGNEVAEPLQTSFYYVEV